jgi:transposase InsO family protein
MHFPVRISDRLPSIRLSPVAIGRKPRSAACFRKRVSVLLPCNHPNGLNGWSLWSRPHASSILRVSALRRTTDWSPKVSHLGSPHENLMRNLSGRRANQEWALDFAHDVLAAGRNIRVLSVVDAFTRECLALEVDTGFASRRVTRVLDEIIAVRGLPQAIRCDNGPELTSRHFLAWALEWKIELRHTQPGKPTQNAHVESFHGRLREECLRVSWFMNLFDARRKVTSWKTEYNEQRPHSSLGYRTPAEFARVVLTPSYGKDVGSAHLENADGVSNFPTAPAAAG